MWKKPIWSNIWSCFLILIILGIKRSFCQSFLTCWPPTFGVMLHKLMPVCHSRVWCGCFKEFVYPSRSMRHTFSNMPKFIRAREKMCRSREGKVDGEGGMRRTWAQMEAGGRCPCWAARGSPCQLWNGNRSTLSKRATSERVVRFEKTDAKKCVWFRRNVTGSAAVWGKWQPSWELG